MRNQHVIVLLLLIGCDGSSPPASHAPFLAASNPPEGSILTVAAGEPRQIEAMLGDDDVDEPLFVRFLLDYPGASAGPALLLQVQVPPSGRVERPAVRMQPNCQVATATPNPHRLLMSVSDRPFLDATRGEAVDPEAPLDSVPDGAHRLRVVWLLQTSCGGTGS